MSAKLATYVAGLLALALLSGCTGLPQQPFNHEANKSIKTIAIVKPPKPKEFQIYYFNHPGMQFGLVGGLMAAAEFENKTSTYMELIDSELFDTSDYFVTRLNDYFGSSDYHAVVLPDAAGDEMKFRTNYPEADVDAYIDGYYRLIGYVAGGPASDYKPTAYMPVRLVTKKSKEVVYADTIVVGESFAASDSTAYVGANSQYVYPKFDDLKADAIKSVEGLKDAIDRIAMHIVDQLVPSDQQAAQTSVTDTDALQEAQAQN